VELDVFWSNYGMLYPLMMLSLRFATFQCLPYLVL
jgi:hypothetical protein